jgi:hypothetical protein
MYTTVTHSLTHSLTIFPSAPEYAQETTTTHHSPIAPMFMNELTPGDKMSLKGKIFELQKKLNLLDVEQQNAQDFSFHPEITGYKLPNRKDDFINNLNQAEETRKERFEALKQQLVLERSEDCSFAPQINRRKKDIHVAKSQKPVFERLTEKGKEYQDSAEKRKEVRMLFPLLC